MNKTFKQECKIINLVIEYGRQTGDIRYAVITDLTEDELDLKYSEELSKYRPFIILSRAMGLAIREHQRNDEKFRKRFSRSTADYESIIDMITVDDEQTIKYREAIELRSKEQFLEAGRKAMALLTPLQRQYIIRYYQDGATLDEIATETGTRRDTVWENLEAARRKFRKVLSDMEVA